MTRRKPTEPPPATAFVTWCCGQRESLEVTLCAALRQPWHVVLVDYSDPGGAGAWAERLGARRLHVVRCAARLDATRRPIQSQARAWMAGIESLPETIETVILSAPLGEVPPGIAAALAQRPADEVWWCDPCLVLPAPLARSVRLCSAYVGAGVEAADLRARLVAGGVAVRSVDLGLRLVARVPPPPLAAIRLLGQRVAALGLGSGPPREALGRLAGAA